MTVKPIPDGFHSVTPYLTVRGAGKMIEFLKKAFGAESVFEPMKRPDGLIMPCAPPRHRPGRPLREFCNSRERLVCRSPQFAHAIFRAKIARRL
jgi:hypothetical protein